MESSNGGDQDRGTQVVEDNIQKLLSPMEPFIMRVQSLLVWEKPRRSAVMFVCVHGLFWYFAFTNCHFYSTVSTLAIFLYFLHTWKRKVWPEIRVPPPVAEDTEGWIPVHPRLLSVPEISHHLASIWCGFLSRLKYWITLRKRRPLAFCIISSMFFLTLATVGRYIPGIWLLYIVVISVLLWPCVLYHNLLQKFYMKFEPVFMKLDYSIKVKSKWSYRPAGDPATMSSQLGSDGDATSSVVADNESDLEEDFYPSSDPAITAALARAITDSEDEGGTGATSSPSMTPHLSKEPSVCNSDDEHQNDIEEDFTPSIDVMPSFDALEHTDDEMLNDFSLNDTTREGSQEPIKFEPSHFDDSSSEEETMRHAISGTDLEAYKVQLAQDFVAQTFSSVIGSALKGFAPDLNTNASYSPRDRVAYTRTDSDEDITMDSPGTSVTSPPVPNKQRTKSEDSGDLDIEDEFEFLDEYEIEEDQQNRG